MDVFGGCKGATPSKAQNTIGYGCAAGEVVKAVETGMPSLCSFSTAVNNWAACMSGRGGLTQFAA